MQFTSNIESFIPSPENLTKLSYEAFQNSKSIFSRVTKPGGIFIICDSMQEDDSPELQTMMSNFPLLFHEPYYKHYTTDNLVERLAKVGFENIKIQNHFVSKYWIANKPQN